MAEPGTYEVLPEHPRKKCEECGVELALVVNPKTGKTVPVRVSTGRSHFTDCPNPARFSRRPKPAGKKAPAGSQPGFEL